MALDDFFCNFLIEISIVAADKDKNPALVLISN